MALKAEQLHAEADKVRLEAMAISKELRPKEFSLERVKGMMDNLVGHVEGVGRITAELGQFEPQMTAEQKTKYAAIKTKSQLLTVFADNKKDILLGADAAKNRTLLRAKADGIAKRAEMLQASAAVLRR
jgi:hypothetical protein